MEILVKTILGTVVFMVWFLSMIKTLRVMEFFGTTWNAKNTGLLIQAMFGVGGMLWFMSWVLGVKP